MMIRVLRLIEYIYPSVEEMERDMGNWKAPANGHLFPGNRKEIRSAVITDFNFKREQND